MKHRHLALVPVLVGGILACGGQNSSPAGSSKPAPPISVDSEAALALAAAFLNEEGIQAGENDGSGPIQAGAAQGMAEPPHPSCVTVTGITANSVTWTFANCTGPHGWTWNGAVVVSWVQNPDGSTLLKHDQKHMVGTKDGKSWTVNGARNLLRNPAAKILRITADPGFTKAFHDGAKTTTYTYACNLTADWSTNGQRKLYGAWGLTPQGGGDGVTGVISTATPLVWEMSASCCYPVSGTLTLTKGGSASAIVHSLPCGSVTVNGEAKTLPACTR